MVNMLEQKLEKSRFTRVDADIIDRLIVKEDAKKTDLSKEQSDNLTEVFRSQMPQLDKTEFFVEIQALGELSFCHNEQSAVKIDYSVERAENQLLTVNSVNPSCSSALFIINVDRHSFSVFKQY